MAFSFNIVKSQDFDAVSGKYNKLCVLGNNSMSVADHSC